MDKSMNFAGSNDFVEISENDVVLDDTFVSTSDSVVRHELQENMDNEITLRPYMFADGMEMLARQLGGVKGFPDADKWCKEAEEDGKAFTVIYEGKMVACAGIITIMEGVGLAWALYPPNIGDYHIDPRIAKDKLKELMAKHDFRRVQATVRVDFPAGASYLRYLGFEREGRMKKYEPDKTDAYLYAVVR